MISDAGTSSMLRILHEMFTKLIAHNLHKQFLGTRKEILADATPNEEVIISAISFW
jgi:hypothetical protein